MKPKAQNKTVNERQAEFYKNFQKNRATKIWYGIRNSLFRDLRKKIGAEAQVYELHKKWLGDLNDKKVLDLGCYAGNSLSYYLAENSREYIGIDLSEPAINSLKKRINKFPGADAIAIDFLSDSFKEREFDVIYAYGVLHHFKDTDELIQKLKNKLTTDGVVISYDPIQTSLPLKIVRTLYRPFQSDKDWEWPFTKKVILKYHSEFKVLDRRSIFGKAKWSFLLNLMPINEAKKVAIGKKWHNEDWDISQKSDKRVFRSMHLTMLMQNKS
ncbi:class I SAM-dependent methyltransferase [Gramella sp. GC03-9]|uniref:Class I SAM-dependent methyltransferase n=1 Tax=Christiangramia oceanisediminis TaxID=2920386 RepID=A0A9X2KUM2_9FLAO|nr:class I SAM-dependent methyltransferase [Gramella oceanisediminis]